MVTGEGLSYYAELESGVVEKKRILLRTEKKSYLDDCVDAFLFLAKKKNLIVVYFGGQDILKRFEDAGGDVNKFHLVEPSNGDFHTVDVSVNSFLKDLGTKNSVVLVVSMHDLVRDGDVNEVGIFLGNFCKRISVEGVPVVIIEHVSADYIFLQIVSSNAEKIVSMRKLGLAKES